MSSPMINLTKEMVNEIGRIGKERKPNEACGVLLPHPRSPHEGSKSQVVELPNRSLKPDTYRMATADIRLAVEELNLSKDEVDRMAIWHTHPGGGIGPSRDDMIRRVRDVPYLVVAIQEDDTFIPAWF